MIFLAIILQKILLVYKKLLRIITKNLYINLEEAFSNEKLEKTLKLITLVPRQKYQIPQTSNQEIGWFSNQLVNFLL